MTRCAQCAAVGWDHDEMESRLKGSLYEFTRLMVSDWVDPELHRPICEKFQEWLGNEMLGYYLVMIPRGHLKTTTFTIAYPIWRLISDPSLRILIAMSSQRLAREKIGKIQSVLLSDTFRHWFGHLVPEISTVRWNKSEIEIVRPTHFEEPSITGVGAESKLTGGHYDIIIPDDLIDVDAENSDVQQDNAIRFLSAATGLWVRRDRAHQVMPCTYWPGPFYDRLLKNKYYKKIVLGAVVDDRFRGFLAECGLATTKEDGETIFKLETKETLAQALIHFGPSRYANQMLNMPSAPGDVSFKPEDIRYFKWDGEDQKAVGIDEVWYPVKTLFRQLTVDPAGGRNVKADESAIIVTGYARGSSVAFVLDSWSGRVPTQDLIDKIIELAERWKVNVIRPEYVALQSILGDYLNDTMMRRGIRFSIDPVRPGPVAKGIRIVKSLQPWVASGQVYFRVDQEKVPNELINVVIDANGKVKGASPNLIDALAYHTEYWRRTPKSEPDLDDIMFEDEEDEAKAERIMARYGLSCVSRGA